MDKADSNGTPESGGVTAGQAGNAGQPASEAAPQESPNAVAVLANFFARVPVRFAELSRIVADDGITVPERMRAYTAMYPPLYPALADLWFKMTDTLLQQRGLSRRLVARATLERGMAMFLLPDQDSGQDADQRPAPEAGQDHEQRRARQRSLLEWAQLHGDPTTKARADLSLAQLEPDPQERIAYLNRAADNKTALPLWRLQAHHNLALAGVSPLFHLTAAKQLAQNEDEIAMITRTADRLFAGD